MRVEAEDLLPREPTLVHVSRRLKDALRAEELLAGAGIEYVVEPDEYRATLFLVIPVSRTGAFFYVARDRAGEARALLAGSGFQVTAEDDAHG